MSPIIDEWTTATAFDALLDSTVAASRQLGALPPRERAYLLRQIGSAIEDASDDLVPIAASETGLGNERLAGEVTRTVNQFRLYADVVEEGSWAAISIDHARSSTSPAINDHRRLNIPLGPVIVFAASNFPFAFGVVGTDTAAALAAGCAVVAKGHPGHPKLARRLNEIVREALLAADCAEELFSLVVGDQIAVDVLRDNRIEAGAFTGSIPGGLALQSIAQSRNRPIPFFAEMGSVNPVVVTPQAWATRRGEIIAGFAASMTQSNGQLCTSPGLLFVSSTEHIEAELTSSLGSAVPQPLLTDAIADGFRRGTASLNESEGVQPVTPFAPTSGRAAAPVVWKTTTGAVTKNPEILDERFGPSSVLVAYESRSDLDATLARLGGQLTASIFSEPGEDIDDILQIVVRRAGRVLNNAWPTGVAVTWSMHHGGPWPATSNAAYGSVGAEAILRFLRPVTYQNFADADLPPALQDANPWEMPRRVDGRFTSIAAKNT